MPIAESLKNLKVGERSRKTTDILQLFLSANLASIKTTNSIESAFAITVTIRKGNAGRTVAQEKTTIS